MSTRLIVVDISSFIFRAFYAIRPLHAPDGTPVNAVSGVLSMMLKLLSKYRPTHILLAHDIKGDTFRNEIYGEYKANRSAPPDDLVVQFPLIEQLLDKMRLPRRGIENFEADDVIGSVVTQWKDCFDEILIASGDKDLMQFVSDKVKMLDTMKEITYGPSEVFEKMGVTPKQIVDYLSIVGDSSDNVPGIRGIGPKGAAKLLGQYQTLDACIEASRGFSNKKTVEAFANYLQDGLLSRQLIEIKTDLALGIGPEETTYTFEPNPELLSFLRHLDFKSVVKKLEDLQYQEQQAKQTDVQEQVFPYRLVGEDISFDDCCHQLQQAESFALYPLFDSKDVISRKLQGIAISIDGNQAFYLTAKAQASLLSSDKASISCQQLDEMLRIVGSKKVYCEDAKELLLFWGQDLFTEYFDVTLGHYVVDSALRHDVSVLAKGMLGFELPQWDKKWITLQEHATFAASYACAIFRLAPLLKEQLRLRQLETVYQQIDLPMVPVLAKMEKRGVLLNQNYLSVLEQEFSGQLTGIELRIAQLSGEQINLKSPKQVGELLFEKLKYPVIKETKTGPSTDVEVLEELDFRGVGEIPGLIIQYRELEKLLSTYIKALPQLINPASGRIHTSFYQTVAATGRLSSVHPNLQNIPVRTENGKLIRKAFIARPGHLLLSADYSQVELRLLAHFSQDSTMINAFKRDEDIHRQTAAEILGKELTQISSEERTLAKAVNFGLMYGQSSFGLAKSLKISRNDAKNYITRYFERFSTVKSYLDSLKEFCEQHGFSQTLHGRKRFIPDIHSRNRNVKALAERLAVNSPIQGTAADVIKLSMIAIDKEIQEKKLQVEMLIQVHDELIFEVPEAEIDVVKSLVKNNMENVVSLAVPLKVDVGMGVNWFDLK